MKKWVQQTGKSNSPFISKSQLKQVPAPRKIQFAVLGDSHVGVGNSGSVFKKVLQKAVASSNKKFVIFGGDNEHGGRQSGKAETYYKEFKNIVKGVLDPKHIPFRASIGNWETNTRDLFKQYLGNVTGKKNFPGTNGKVIYVWLDNASGKFSTESLALLKTLDANHHYIIDFHWPLKVNGITRKINASHVLSQEQTNMFFMAIPSRVRNKILAIFTHHAHKFYKKTSNIYPGFPKTKFFVCGCSGDYSCTNPGYYDATLTILNNQFTVTANEKH